MSERTNGKDVIYIDVDDEITSIIDKVRGSHSKIVALVLPKRATMLQSVVNMKLLKRSADESKKNLVLITSEYGLMPLAGGVGLYVAKTLQSKPEIPTEPDMADGMNDGTLDESEDLMAPAAADAVAAHRSVQAAAAARSAAADQPLDRSRSVGELSGGNMDDAIEFDNDNDDKSAGPDQPAPGKDGKPKDKKLAIPNFNKFRLLTMLAGVAIVLIGVFMYLALSVLPKAAISIQTDSQAVTSSTIVTLKTGDAVAVNVDEGLVPARSQQMQKTFTEQSAATGQQNNGQKATGSVVMSAGSCSADVPAPVPAGTGVSAGGVTFLTGDEVTFGPVISGGKCSFRSGDVDIVAQSPGAKYNIGASSFTVAGRSSVTASSSDPTIGGTDDIIKIVTQSDIDNATQKITGQDATAMKTQLKNDLKNLGYLPVEVTFNPGQPQTKTSANAGDKADTVSVTQTITYTMLGAKKADLEKIVGDDVKGNIDTKKQKILDYGLDSVVFGLQSQPADGAVLTMQATAVAGPELNADDLKKQVAGKKANEAKEIVKKNPGVTDVEVKYSPFWVSSIPSKSGKITVTIEKPQKTVKSNNSSNAESSP